MQVEQGNIYLLRTVNTGLSNALFLSVAGHKLTVVGSDGAYTKPLTTDYIVISPGETMDLLLEAEQSPELFYYIAARALDYRSLDQFDNSTTTAILAYTTYNSSNSDQTPLLPTLPSYNDTGSATAFTSQLRSLAPPTDLPQPVNREYLIVVSLNKIDQHMLASLNNISFASNTTIDILGAYYNMVRGVFGVYFPERPPYYYNFTAEVQPDNVLVPKIAREVKVLNYGDGIEVVLQGTSVVMAQDHPMHLHGYSFYVVGWGFGNFERERDRSAYNLVDPPLKNTISVPRNGWVALRFLANNPGKSCSLVLHIFKFTVLHVTLFHILMNVNLPQHNIKIKIK